MLFEVEGIQRNKRVKKRFEAETQKELMKILKEYDFIPIKIKPLVRKRISLIDSINFNDIVNFTRQLAMMLNAGLSLVECFNILKRQTYKQSLLRLYEEIDRDIKEGVSLSSSLRKYRYFSNVYIAMIKAGEASGKLTEILLRLADTLEASKEFRTNLRSALTYPVIVIVVMIAVMFFMITFVIPQLLEIYQNFELDLPLSTQILIKISNFSRDYWYLIVATFAGVAYLFKKYIETDFGKRRFDSLLINIPVVGTVVRKGVLVESTRTLSVLIKSGVSILDALNIIINTTDNIIFKEAFKKVTKQVKRGVSLGKAMENEEIFPPILVQMVKVGETTGHLDETLEKIAYFFEMESRVAIKTMTTLIEPAILIILAAGVGFLVMSVITPIYNLTTAF